MRPSTTPVPAEEGGARDEGSRRATGTEIEDVVEACRCLRTAQLDLRRVIEETEQLLLQRFRVSGQVAAAVASRAARAALLRAGATPEELARAGVDQTGLPE